ncbi:seminase [Drosophila rhopaloa]|uniref:Trypsin n=1 Tax=Drosophila rhopaloa TaxID=1041015 RepID=A0A6P4EH62_DRORH|nr:seminase [Drosophila rhopaloa]
MYPMQRMLACCLLAATLSRIDVFARDIGETIDLERLGKLVLPSGLQTRVVGGHVTTNEKLGGYLIALRYQKEFICGGTLLQDLIVLTAAHCFIGRPKTGEWVASGGISKLNEKGIQRQVRTIIKSAQFRESDMNMDVAILRLKSPMKGKNIGRLSLCSTPLKPGLQLVVSGWGMTDARGVGPETLLRSVTVPVVDKNKCRAAYRQSVNLTNSMFCASLSGKKDACTYDSGGPLVYKNQVCGIVSFGIGCASRRYSGVYTDVNYIKPFIEKSIKALKR